MADFFVPQISSEEPVLVSDLPFTVPPYNTGSHKTVWNNGGITLNLKYENVDAFMLFYDNKYIGSEITKSEENCSSIRVRDIDIVITRKNNNHQIQTVQTNTANSEELFKTELEWVAEH
jgi:hypothetical protein